MAPRSSVARSAVRRLATARMISLAGGAAAYLALNFEIYERTGSATWVAAVLFVTFGTIGFVSPVAGMIGDRFDRRKVMIASDLVGMVLFLAMAFVRDPGVLVALAFGTALAEAPFLAASTAAIPNLIDDPEKDLAWANGLVALGRNAGIVVGPIIGGILVATVGAGSVFAINAVTFGLSALLVASVRGRFNAGRDGETADEHRGIRAGFRYLWAERVLRTLALAWLPLVLGLGMAMVADVALAELFGTGAFGYGAIIAAWGAGSIVGSLLGRYLRATTEGPAFVLSLAVVAVTAAGMGLAPLFWLVLVAVFAMGIGDGVTMVAQQGIMQRRTPDAIRSRVAGAFDAVLHGGLAVSYVAAGPAVAALGARGVYVVGGIATAGGVLIGLPLLRARRRPDREVLVTPEVEPGSIELAVR